MAEFRRLLPILLFLPLAGCFSDQKAQLAACEAAAPTDRRGPALQGTQTCMDKAGYRFIGWDDGVVCGMAAVIKGQSLADGTDALCFEPKNWLALKIYRIEVPSRSPALRLIRLSRWPRSISRKASRKPFGNFAAPSMTSLPTGSVGNFAEPG